MNGFFRHAKHTRTWGEIAADFFTAVKENINEAIYEQRIRMAKKVAAMITLAIGGIFFLVGLSIYIGMLINKAAWSGYMIVGIVLVAIGLIFARK